MKIITKIIVVFIFFILIVGCNNDKEKSETTSNGTEENKLVSTKYWMGNVRNDHTELDYTNYTVISYVDNTLYSFNEDGTGNYYDITAKTIDAKTSFSCNDYKTFKYEYKDNNLTIEFDDNSKKTFTVSITYDSKYKHNNLFLNNEKYSAIDDDSFNDLNCNN